MSLFKECFPPTISLETKKVQLRLLQPKDFDSLLPVSKSEKIWKYFTKNLFIESELKKWIEEAVDDYQHERRVPFVIINKANGELCGSTSFGNISFYDRRLEIGWTWVGENIMGTGINTHAKYLLLKHAFEKFQAERVEIKTDNLNERAKQALVKIGATPEGVLRSHMLMFDGRRRDSVYFSVVKSEWERVSVALEEKL